MGRPTFVPEPAWPCPLPLLWLSSQTYLLTVPVGGKAQEAEAALVGAGRCVVVVPLELKEEVAVSSLLLPP